MTKSKLNVQGVEIKLKRHNEQDYFSLTDIARHADTRTDAIIQGYLRNGANLDFLATWEEMYNPDFNPMNFNGIRQRAGSGAFVLSVNEWVEKTGAVGIFASPGRYGGTYGHKDIALQFATWISPSFYLYLIKEFDRLKAVEADALGLSWNLRREISKANYTIHTEAVRTNIVPMLDWNTRKEGLYFASEADLLNLAVFGTTAKQWKSLNPEAKGNLRDNASVQELQVLANMESSNAMLIEQGFNKEERLSILTRRAERELDILEEAKAIQGIKKLK
jgi:hypothetical protein